MELEEKTQIQLEKVDAALIIKGSGEAKLILPNSGSDEVTESELLISSLGFFLRDPKFVEMIKMEFVKHIQNSMINPENKDI